MDISATLTLDAGPFSAALSSVMDAIEALAGEAGTLSSSLADTQSKLQELAAGTERAASAHEDATQATEAHTDALDKNAAAEADVASATDAASKSIEAGKAGMSAMGAATNIMSGNAAGAAGSVMSLSGAVKALGMSANALPLVAVLAGVVALCVKLRNEARQLKLDSAFDAAKYASERLQKSIARVNDEMSRQTSLARELRGIAQGGEDVQGQIALEKLEKERQEALRGKSGEEQVAINAEFDRRRNRLVRDNAVAASERNAAEYRTQKSENLDAIGQLGKQLASVMRLRAEAAGRVVAENSRGGGNRAEADRYRAMVAEQDKAAASLRSQIRDLEDTNKILDAKVAAEAGNAALAEAAFATANATVDTSLANAVSEAVAEEDGKSGVGGGRDAAVQTDRLARIGGFVGGAAPMRRTEDLLREGNSQRKELIASFRTGMAATFA